MSDLGRPHFLIPCCLSGALALVACTPISRPSALPQSPPAPYINSPTVKLMLFGGKDHKVYLGCLNCGPSAYDSIFNTNGPYGRCPGPFDDNLYCRGPFKEFGSSGPFHDASACGTNASDPPVIVDDAGRYYGRFSIGGPFGHADSVCASLFGSFRNESVCAIVKRVCSQ